jgi:hypothetical protein
MFGFSTRRKFLVASSGCFFPKFSTSNNSQQQQFLSSSSSPSSSCCSSSCSFAGTVAPFVADAKRFQSVPGAASYKCSACGKAFRMPNALTHHITTKHGGDAQSIPLDSAGKPITTIGSTSTSSTTTATATTTPPAASNQQQTPTQTSPPQQQQPPSASSSTSSASSIPVPDPTGVSTDSPPASSQQQQISEEEFSKKSFVCTICQKPFRIEAALLHHYKAKHGIEQAGGSEIPAAPELSSEATTSTTQQQQSNLSNEAQTSTNPNEQTVSVNDVSQTMINTQQQQQQQQQASSASSAQYQIHNQQQQQQQQIQHATTASETVTAPLPPQYHLDVAPNAPEEREIAVHHACVNNITLLGAAQDAAVGYVFEDRVLQFVVATAFDSPAPGDPDRDFHTVRVYLKGGDSCKDDQTLVDNYFGKDIADQLMMMSSSSSSASGSNKNLPTKKVLVSGRLRMVPQYEPTTGRYYHFPVVQVQQGSGYVKLVE